MASQETLDEARRMRGEGRPYREIAERFDVHTGTVFYWLNGRRTRKPRKSGEDYTCGCGKPAVDVYKRKPICAKCLNPDFEPLSIDDYAHARSTSLAQFDEVEGLENVVDGKGGFRERVAKATRKLGLARKKGDFIEHVLDGNDYGGRR